MRSRNSCFLLVLWGGVTLFPEGTWLAASQAPVSSSPVSRKSEREAMIAQIVAPFFAKGCHVGLSIVVVQSNQTAFYSFGSNARGTSTAPTPDSVYEIASVTKTFTGALAAEALREERMQLDADFRPYLPENYPNLAWQSHAITLRTLATHTSGLPRDLPDSDDLFAHPDPETLPFQLITRESSFNSARYWHDLHSVTLRNEPGTQEVYSNLGFKVIGWGLETVYGTPYEKLVETKILAPLHMSSTGFVLNRKERSRLVKGYSPAGRPMPYHLRNAGAAYGLYATPRDMAKFVQWQLNERDSVVRMAHMPVRGDNCKGQALVWNLSCTNGERTLSHGGGTFGMSSQVVLFPRGGEGYVLLANDTCAGTETALRDLGLALHRRLGPEIQ